MQTEAQLDKMIGLYDASITNLNDSLAEERGITSDHRHGHQCRSVAAQRPSTRAYIFQVFGVDEKTYSYAHIKGLMTSDVSDPDSYINQKYGGGL